MQRDREKVIVRKRVREKDIEREREIHGSKNKININKRFCRET